MEVAVTVAFVALLAFAAFVGTKVHQIRHHVVTVDTPGGLRTFFTCTCCGETASTQARYYMEPVCRPCHEADPS